MPVGWKREEWPLAPDSDVEAVTNQRNILVHTIGNLTLTTNKLNASISNASWEHKRKELQKHATLLLNNELTSTSSWNEESIRDRSRRMAELISSVWPGPDSEKWK